MSSAQVLVARHPMPDSATSQSDQRVRPEGRALPPAPRTRGRRRHRCQVDRRSPSRTPCPGSALGYSDPRRHDDQGPSQSPRRRTTSHRRRAGRRGAGDKPSSTTSWASSPRTTQMAPWPSRRSRVGYKCVSEGGYAGGYVGSNPPRPTISVRFAAPGGREHRQVAHVRLLLSCA